MQIGGICRHLVDRVRAGAAWTCVEVVGTVVRRCVVYIDNITLIIGPAK